MSITLRPIDDTNREAVLALSVREDQPFVAPNDVSLRQYAEAEAEEPGVARPFAIYADDTLVGFCMFVFAPEEEDPDLNPKISGPSVSSIQLLSWYDVVKPSISNGQHLLVYEPSSGLSWTVRVLARGRHCDAEPLTARDTRTMVKAFGGINTWNQKGVYVQLPDGRWSVASTHDMPHESSTIKDNDFNGHLCVHFLRTMEEAKKNDPNYGVANQETIRQMWKNLTGQDVTD